jgi:hypothetical protein
MKLSTILLSALLGFSTAFAQIPGMMSTQVSSAPEGTALGANETLTAAGIALGNRVKMRGYIDFLYSYADGGLDVSADDDSRFTTSSDVDFLLDLSPVTAELHLNLTGNKLLEQAFGRYAVNDVFNFTFGRQKTVLSYEGDEPTDLLSVSNGYFSDVLVSHPALVQYLDDYVTAYNILNPLNPITREDALPNLRRNYRDGIRANFNNGQFGLSFGIHDGYWQSDDFNNNVALDIAASVMLMPGLEARLGYAHQDVNDMNIGHFNTWIAYNPGDLTLAFEYDFFDFDSNSDLWDIMLLGSYQFTDFFAASLRYSHEDGENLLGFSDYDTDRFSLALLFTITNNFGINVEYSHTEIDTNLGGTDADEFYIEGLISY